jgi:hypothetical protein
LWVLFVGGVHTFGWAVQEYIGRTSATCAVTRFNVVTGKFLTTAHFVLTGFDGGALMATGGTIGTGRARFVFARRTLATGIVCLATIAFFPEFGHTIPTHACGCQRRRRDTFPSFALRLRDRGGAVTACEHVWTYKKRTNRTKRTKRTTHNAQHHNTTTTPQHHNTTTPKHVSHARQRPVDREGTTERLRWTHVVAGFAAQGVPSSTPTVVPS